MFREIILPMFRSTRLSVTACGAMHSRCCRPKAGNIGRPDLSLENLVTLHIGNVHYLAKTNRPDALISRSGVFTPGTLLDMMGGTKNQLVMSVT